MEALRDQILERMILERIIEQKARETGVRVDDNMLNSAIEQIAANNNMTVPQLEKDCRLTVLLSITLEKKSEPIFLTSPLTRERS